MSMSQEEIEALMNGIDASDDGDESEADEPMDDSPVSEEDIDDLIAKTTDMLNTEDEEVDETEDTSVDDLISSLKEEEQNASADLPSESDLDDILAGIDGIHDSQPSVEEETSTSSNQSKNNEVDEETIKNWTDSKINEGVFPLPVEKNHKVVNQLSEVANDSEEKASRIFDVLSFILDENSVVQKNTKELDAFIDRQITLYTALSNKFPNISLFKSNLENAQEMKNKPKEIMNRLNDENNQLFEAMELMQYHDINRQKIERVMSVIRKLSSYLNNIFEDDGSHAEVAVAKHIPGDATADLVGSDDLDALIAEFGK